MISGDNDATARWDVFDAAKLNPPQRAAQPANHRSNDFQRPLRKHLSPVRRRILLHGICAVATTHLSFIVFHFQTTKWKMFILQRPILIDELDLDSRDAVRSSVSGADSGVGLCFVLLACQTNKASLLKIQCRKKRRSATADTLRNGLFGFYSASSLVQQLNSHIDCDLMPRLGPSITKDSINHLFCGR